MGVSSGRSRVADLSYQIFGRVLHPDWFAVRRHRRYSQAAWEADVRIIEGGHAIIWNAGGVRLSEVLAGPETRLPEPGLLYHATLRHEQSTALRPGEQTEYQTCFAVERIDAQIFAHLSDELLLDASREGLFHRFRPTNRMVSAPLSRIYVDVRSAGLSVQCFHTFPDERAIVRTQSLFEVRPALPR